MKAISNIITLLLILSFVIVLSMVVLNYIVPLLNINGYGSAYMIGYYFPHPGNYSIYIIVVDLSIYNVDVKPNLVRGVVVVGNDTYDAKCLNCFSLGNLSRRDYVQLYFKVKGSLPSKVYFIVFLNKKTSVSTVLVKKAMSTT